MIELPEAANLRLDGVRALVTGASSGIGVGCATQLARAGASVLCLARGEKALKDLVSTMESHNLKAQYAVCDINQLDQLARIFDEEDPFTVVVNAAGTNSPTAAIDVTEDNFDAIVNLNLKAAYFLSVYAAKAIIAQKESGSIIHISSQMGLIGGVERSVYCASKHGVEGMIKAMAIEWGAHNIRINSICPTFVRTPMTESTFQNPQRVAWAMEKIKLNRIAHVRDIMGAVLYLASQASAMVTGSALKVDGGWTAG